MYGIATPRWWAAIEGGTRHDGADLAAIVRRLAATTRRRPPRARRRAPRRHLPLRPLVLPATTPTPRTSRRPRWCGRSQRAPMLRDPERAKWYLLRIVRNLAIDQARARARVSVEPWADRPRRRVAPSSSPRRCVLRADDGPRPARRVRRPPARSTGGAATSGSSRSSTTQRSPRGSHTTEHAARQRVYRAMQALRA